MMETKVYCDVCGAEILDCDEYYTIVVRHEHPTHENPFYYENLVDIDLCTICYFKEIEKRMIDTIGSVEK